ncbi:hypothetical protein [Massilia sp. CCM 8734]|uniref:hypothetical protein n=1 Tax=Massilia sp. CCM 8734 TaxID=2609283 RepID=UPI001423C989|nr:hypothetical protein [Massilia sp. CCM 8734]NHZ94615.1 hypothetical protein [Massilia sp. CCM 8734]
MGKAEFDAIAAVGNLHNGAVHAFAPAQAAFGRVSRMSAEEQRNAAIAKQATRIAKETIELIRAGDVKTLRDFANVIGDKLSEAGVGENLLRTAMSCGDPTTGRMYADLVRACIADDAEKTATKEIERQEAAHRTSFAEARADRAAHDRAMA